MRYFLDAEFNGFGGELLSLALAPEDEGLPAFYHAVSCTNPTLWVSEHVKPVLATVPMSRDRVAQLFFRYLHNDENPVLVSDWPEDIANAARLLVTGPGTMLPIRRIRFELVDSAVITPYVPSKAKHNALRDAEALRATVLTYEDRLHWEAFDRAPYHTSP